MKAVSPTPPLRNPNPGLLPHTPPAPRLPALLAPAPATGTPAAGTPTVTAPPLSTDRATQTAARTTARGLRIIHQTAATLAVLCAVIAALEGAHAVAWPWWIALLPLAVPLTALAILRQGIRIRF